MGKCVFDSVLPEPPSLPHSLGPRPQTQAEPGRTSAPQWPRGGGEAVWTGVAPGAERPRYHLTAVGLLRPGLGTASESSGVTAGPGVRWSSGPQALQSARILPALAQLFSLGSRLPKKTIQSPDFRPSQTSLTLVPPRHPSSFNCQGSPDLVPRPHASQAWKLEIWVAPKAS